MSHVTYMICLEDERCRPFVERIEKILGRDIYSVVYDDWRRPIVDGILASITYYYSEIEENWDKIKQILELMNHHELYKAIRRA